jgi:RHS repeat-associated protein
MRRTLLVLLMWLAATPCVHAIPDGPEGSTTGDAAPPFTGLAGPAEAQLLTGGAVTRVPIDVPSGRNGMQPNLALAYSSHAPQGPYGAGWDVPIGRVERSTRLGMPHYDATDTFVVMLPDGSQELVQLPDGSWAARIDESHVRITPDTVNDRWTMHDTAGRDYVFGGSAEARTGPAPATFAQTFSWSLTQVRDANGNSVDFTWQQPAGSGWSYPLQVSWGGNVTAGLAHFYSVDFTLAPRAASATRLSFGAGFAQVFDRTLTGATVRYRGQQVRRYEFSWGTSPNNGLPLLQSVLLHGSDDGVLAQGDGTPAATTFGYQDHAAGPPFVDKVQSTFPVAAFRDDDSCTLSQQDPTCTTCRNKDFIDLNGDGRPDLVDTSGWTTSNRVWKVYLNQGPDAPGLFATSPTSWSSEQRCIVKNIYNLTIFPDDSYLTDSTTTWAVVDVNGDGRPDQVLPGAETYFDPVTFDITVYWYVYPNTGSGFGPLEKWSFPDPVSRLDGVRASGIRDTPSCVTLDLIDLNADGRPDLVDSTPTSNGKWNVRWNLGGGAFSANDEIAAPWQCIRIGGPGTDNRNITRDIFDLNGDGLVDVVSAQGNTAYGSCQPGPTQTCWHWNVRYGTGRDFLPVIEMPSPPIGALRSWNEAETAYSYDVFDINGDGLPDVVDARGFSTAGQWTIYFNTGRGFDGGHVWTMPAKMRKRHPNEALKALTIDTFDVDGDGFPDVVEVANGGAVFHLAQPGALPDVLRTLARNPRPGGGAAAVTTLDYAAASEAATTNLDPGVADGRLHLPFPLWVLRGTRSAAAGSPADLARTYRYDGGYWDPVRREFRGFHVVDATDAYGVTERTVFGQTDALRGKTLEEATYARLPSPGAPQGLLTRSTFDWRVATATSRVVPYLFSMSRTDYASAADSPWQELAGGQRTAYSEYTYDACGNVTREQAYDGGTLLSDNRSTFAGVAGGCNAYQVCTGLCDRASQISIVGGVTKNLTYDGAGNVKTVQMVGPGNPTTTNTYDAYGNLTEVLHPNGALTRVQYADGADHLRPTSVTEDANGLALTTTTTYDQALGKVATVTEPAGAVARYRYDRFGRLEAVAEPGQTLAQPTRQYAYVLGAEQRIDELRLELHPSVHQVTTSRFFDGLGRPLQTQVVQRVDGVVRTVVRDAVVRVFGGRVAREIAPVAVDGDPRVRASVDDRPGTWLVDDEFGRLIARSAADGSLTTFSHRTPRVTRSCDAVYSEDPSAGACVEEEVDALKRKVFTRTYLSGSGTPYSTKQLFYDPGGRGVVRERDNGDPRTDVVVTYDALGRRTSVTHPDSGTWRYAYDTTGNLVYQDDPVTGRHIEIEYDRVNRPTRRVLYTGSDTQGAGTAGAVLAQYAYDTATGGRGRLASVTDPSGETTFEAYDPRGNLLRSRKTITFAGVTREFTTEATTDALGRVITATYPWPGGVEVVSYDYSPEGLPLALRSDQGAYVDDQQRNVQGQLTERAYANGLHDRFVYGDATDLFHLRQIETVAPGGSPPLRSLEYFAYDANGNVRGIRDLQHTARDPRSLTQTAGYDDGGRLKSSRQCGAFGYTAGFTQDSYGNFVSKAGAGYTPDATRPHRIAAVAGESIGYDANGEMTALPGGRQLVYDAEGRLTEVWRDGDLQGSYLYDYRGQRVAARTSEGTTFFFGTFDLRLESGTVARHFLLEGQLIATSVVEAPVLARAAPGGTMLAGTVAGLGAFLLLGVGIAFPGRRRLGAVGRVRRGSVAVLAVLFFLSHLPFAQVAFAACETLGPPEGTVFYHPDHLGTPQLLTDAHGAVVERAVTRPYGETGGLFDDTGGGVVASQAAFQFTGHRRDDGTGLIYFGARWYDPELGMFVTPDPRAQFPNPYSYVSGNPLNAVDPGGAFAWIPFLIGILIGAALGAAISVIQAAVNGASGSQLLKAAALGAAMGAIAGAVFGIVGPAVEALKSPALSLAYNLAVAGYSAYGAVHSFQNGQIVFGLVAVLGAAVALKGAGGGLGGVLKRGPSPSDLAGTQFAANTDVANDAYWLGVDPPIQQPAIDPIDLILLGAAIKSGAKALYALGRAAFLEGEALLAGRAAVRVFWSGGRAAEEAALAWAEANGGVTLEMTQAGQAVEAATKGLDWASEARALWATVSREFAAGAQGEVHVFQGPVVSIDSIWATVEYPALMQNGQVTNVIYHVVGGP